MFKADQEPSILDLESEVVAELGGSHEMIMEASPVNDHPSNRVVERVFQTVGRMIRTHKLALEQSYKTGVGGRSCGGPMIDHACGSDGLIV